MNLEFLPTLDIDELEKIASRYHKLGFEHYHYGKPFSLSTSYVKTPSGMMLTENMIKEYFQNRKLEFGNPA